MWLNVFYRLIKMLILNIFYQSIKNVHKEKQIFINL